MLWAVACLWFFAFRRGNNAFREGIWSTSSPLFRGCKVRQPPISFNVTGSDKVLQDWPDLFRLGLTLYIGAMKTELCPVAAVTNYMLARRSKEGPLFLRQNGYFFTQECFVQAVREALVAAGLEAENYAGHSFCIGAATTAAQCSLPESTIKILGHWQSSAYMLCIKTPREILSNVGKVLATR